MIPSADLLHWLRELPSRRALHTLKLIAALLRKHRERTWDERLSHSARELELAEARGICFCMGREAWSSRSAPM